MRRELIWSGSKQLLWDWSPRVDNLGNPITGAGGLHLFCPSLSPHPSVRPSSRDLALLKSDWFFHIYFGATASLPILLWSQLLSPRSGPDWLGSSRLYPKTCGTLWHHLQLEEALGRRRALATVSSWVCSWKESAQEKIKFVRHWRDMLYASNLCTVFQFVISWIVQPPECVTLHSFAQMILQRHLSRISMFTVYHLVFCLSVIIF